MKTENVDLNKLEEAKKKLKKATFAEPPVNVCTHLLNLSEKHNDIRYVAIQFLEDSYYLFWCCNNCGNAHNVPFPGVYVVDEQDLNDNRYNGFITKNSDDEDYNPYQKLLNENKGLTVSRDEFNSSFETNINHIEIINSKYKTPFGKVILKCTELEE